MNYPFASGAWPSPTTLTKSEFSSPVAMINPRDFAHSKIWPIVSPQNEQEILVQGLVRTRFWSSSSETLQRTPSVTGRKVNPGELEIRRSLESQGAQVEGRLGSSLKFGRREGVSECRERPRTHQRAIGWEWGRAELPGPGGRKWQSSACIRTLPWTRKTWSCATGICESVLCVFASLIQRYLLVQFSFWDRYPHRSRGGSDSLPRPVRLLARQPLPMPSPCEAFRLSQ